MAHQDAAKNCALGQPARELLARDPEGDRTQNAAAHGMTCETTSQPLASILIGNYNYGRFLRDAIDSALNQTYPNIEVVVVDDGSTDDSRQIMTGYGDRIVPVLKENGGQASAFNAGFAASRGEWVLLLDSDDVFKPTKTAEILRLAKENPSVGTIVHNLEYCDADGQPLNLLPPQISVLELVDDRARVRRGSPTARMPATSGLCLRRDIIGQILPMPEGIRVTADNYVKIVALSLSPVLQTPAALAKQRIHGGNLYTGMDFRKPTRPTRLRRVHIQAAIGFEVGRTHRSLRGFAWKQYGAILCHLVTHPSREARALMREIRKSYNVVEPSPTCLFAVAGAFAETAVVGILRRLKMVCTLWRPRSSTRNHELKGA